MARLNSFFLLFVIGSMSISPAVWADKLPDTWTHIVQLRQDQESAVSSLEVSLRFMMKADIPGHPLDITKQISFGRQDDKCFFKEEFISNNLITGGAEMRYDGMFSRRRTSLIPNIMTVSSLPADRKFDTPPPDQIIEPYTTKFLAEHLTIGDISRLSCSNDKIGDSECAKIDFELRDGKSRQRLEIWYNLSCGGWPIQFRLYNEKNQLVDQIKDVKLAKIVAQNNEFYYPVAGVSEVFAGSAVAMQMSFLCDVKSIRINQPIDRLEFLLKPKPGEMVVDKDTNTTVLDHGK